MVDELLLTGREEQIVARLAGYRRAVLRTPVIAVGGVEPHGAGDAFYAGFSRLSRRLAQ